CGDPFNELDESFLVDVLGATQATGPVQIDDGQALGTIQNDDHVPTLSIAGTTVTETDAGAAAATLSLSLSTASGQGLTVQPLLSAGSAVGGHPCGAGADFDNAALPAVRFPKLQRTAQVTVPVCGELAPELTESFGVNLDPASVDPTKATIGSGHASVTIRD